RWFYWDGSPELLFTENETNSRRIFGSDNAEPRVKDGINEFIVNRNKDAVKSVGSGTKSALPYTNIVAPGGSVLVRMRLSDKEILQHHPITDDFELKFADRKSEAEEFYRSVIPEAINAERKNIMRQALAGLLWSKQYYGYQVERWLRGDPGSPEPSPERLQGRNID
ncbi:MAG TPA: hypothetical protein VIK64_11680, partial [Anaerolineales bacterium]